MKNGIWVEDDYVEPKREPKKKEWMMSEVTGIELYRLGEDGKRQMEKYEVFYSAGGMRDILVMQMQQAILNPDPNKQLMGLNEAQAVEE